MHRSRRGRLATDHEAGDALRISFRPLGAVTGQTTEGFRLKPSLPSLWSSGIQRHPLVFTNASETFVNEYRASVCED